MCALDARRSAVLRRPEQPQGVKLAVRTSKVLWGVDAAPQRPLPRTVARPFPAQTVRDLIGIARLLYRTWAAASARDTRLPELVAIGKDLQQALRMAQDHKPGTRQHREAWSIAEVATSRLGGIVDAYVAVKPLISAAFERVDENGAPSEREAQRKARQAR